MSSISSPAITFDAPTHVYRADGRVLTSVTTILKAVGLYDTHEFTDPKHRMMGSAVHKICQLIDSGRYDEEATHEEIRPFGRAYQKFVADTGFKGLFWEQGFGDPTLGVGGTFDVIGQVDGEFWMLDFKKGNVPDLVPVQLAAYESLLATAVPINAYLIDHAPAKWNIKDWTHRTSHKKKALRLEAGRYTLLSRTKRDVPYDDPRWKQVWRAAVTMYQVRREYGRA